MISSIFFSLRIFLLTFRIKQQQKAKRKRIFTHSDAKFWFDSCLNAWNRLRTTVANANCPLREYHRYCCCYSSLLYTVAKRVGATNEEKMCHNVVKWIICTRTSYCDLVPSSSSDGDDNERSLTGADDREKHAHTRQKRKNFYRILLMLLHFYRAEMWFFFSPRRLTFLPFFLSLSLFWWAFRCGLRECKCRHKLIRIWFTNLLSPLHEALTKADLRQQNHHGWVYAHQLHSDRVSERERWWVEIVPKPNSFNELERIRFSSKEWID